MSLSILEKFKTNRVTFQRLTDAQFFAGWITTVQKDSLWVRCTTESTLQAGDQFLFQVHGPEGRLTMVGTFRSAKLGAESDQNSEALRERHFEFLVTGQLAVMNSSENARFLMTPYAVRLTKADAEEPLTSVLVDASVGGFGVRCSEKIEKGTTLEFEIASGSVLVQGKATVRYCRSESKENASFRVGLQFEAMNRIDALRWTALIKENQAA
jgi:hypothetical protein